jgi:FlgD Ig-like domain
MEVILKRIIFALIISLIFVAIFADEEIISRRTFFSKTYHIENNNYRTRLHSQPIHYLDNEYNLVNIPFNEENSDSLIALAWHQSLGRDIETFDPYNNSEDNGSIQAIYYIENEWENTYYASSEGYFGRIDNSEYWDDTLQYETISVDSVIERQYNQYYLWDEELFDYEGCSVLYYATELYIHMDQELPTGYISYERLNGNNIFLMDYGYAFNNILGTGTQIFTTNGVDVDYCVPYDCNDDFTVDFVNDVIDSSYFFNISIVNDQSGAGSENEPNSCQTSIDIYFNVYFTISGTVFGSPEENPPIVHLESGNWYDVETVSDDSTYFFDNIPYISGGRDIHIFLTDPDYPYLYTYIDQNYYDVTASLINCNFEAIDPVSISGSFLNHHPSTSLEGLELSFYDDENVLLNQTTVAGDSTYTILVPSGCTGRLVPSSSTFIIYPEELTFTNIIEHQTEENFDAYLESQISQISGNVSIYDGNGDFTDVIIEISDSSGPYTTLSPDVNGDYSFEITPLEYDDYFLHFNLMSLNCFDDDYYEEIRNLTINSGDDHVFDISMIAINTSDLIVDSDTAEPGFHTFNAAIDYIREMNDDLENTTVVINGATGTYSDNIDVFDLEDIDLVINGEENCVINGQLNPDEHGIAFYDCSFVELTINEIRITNWNEGGFVENSTTNSNCEITIRNCLIDGNCRTTATRGEYGGGIEVYSPAYILNNEIRDNSAPIGGGGIVIFSSSATVIEENLIQDNVSSYGGGIAAYAPISILNNEISTNSASQKGGGIYMSSSTGTTSIEDNLIDDNISFCGGGMHLKSTNGWDHTVNFDIIGNTYTANNVTNQPSPLGANIVIEYVGEVDFKNNIITETNGQTDLTVTSLFQHIYDMNCVNNTFADNSAIAASFYDYHYLKFINNIVSGNIYNYQELYPVRINIDPDYTYEVKYNCLYGNSVNTFQTAIADENTITENPCLSTSFTPQWNATVKSSCIDTGDPDFDGDNHNWWEDDDDCYILGDNNYRMYIGAKPGEVDGGGHRDGVAVLRKNLTWNWISIPPVDNYSGSNRNFDKLYNILNQNMGNELLEVGTNFEHNLDKINWQYNDDAGSFYWYEDEYSFDNINHETRSQYGYKLKLSDDAEDKEFIQYSGVIPGGYNYDNLGNPGSTLHIIPPDDHLTTTTFLNDATLTYERETWMGYFKEYSMNPLDALLPIIDDIVEIKAQHWCLSRILIAPGGRETLTYGDNWAGAIDPEGVQIAINYGEMVAVRFIGDTAIDFRWGGDTNNPPITPFYSRDLAECFDYEEQEDYVPVYINIDLDCYEEGNKPIEVAILVDEECKGAAVIKEKQVQLNAYILNDSTLTLENLEFVLYFPSRSVGAVKADYSVYDPYSGRYESRKATAQDCSNYLMVSLTENEEYQLPAVTQLCQNYPNPFNPETRINFELEQNAKVTLEIYNLKGQKISTLVNDKLTAGYYTEIWHGKNDKGNRVASGIYFYKLITSNGDCLTRKMILMK